MFVNWSRRSRTHLTMLFNKIYNNKACNPFSTTKQMIQDVGNVELFELCDTPRRSAKHASLTGMSASSIAHAGISCRKKQRPIEVSLDIRWTFFHFQSFVVKKGRPHGHRWEKPGDKEYYLANQLKKKCKKKKFQGIHDRFLRDHEFRVRMIEHIEMKKFVDDGMFLQRKITVRRSYIYITRTNGGSIPINRVLTPYH